MESFLQRRIKNYLNATGLSVSALERQAGLKINVARNILRGQSKKPSAETLQAIASVMECSVQDLLGVKKESFTSDIRPADDGSPLLDHPELLNEALQCTLRILQEKEHNVTVKQALIIAEEVYGYAMKKSPPHVEVAFVEWFIKRMVW